MNRFFFRSLAVISVVLVATGCATTRPKPAAPDANAQITAMQTQLQAKDQEIQDLRYQLDSRQQSLSNNFSSGGSSDKKNMLRAAGVTPIELQKALLRAGYDPGPVDGRLGKKTRSAVKAFQKKNGLTADGVVGEKTWATLKSY